MNQMLFTGILHANSVLSKSVINLTEYCTKIHKKKKKKKKKKNLKKSKKPKSKKKEPKKRQSQH